MARAGGWKWTCDVDFAGLAARAEAAAGEAATAAGEAILERSRAAAPRRTGAMAASARAEAKGGRAVVRYGAIYARIQHERGDLRHAGGGRAGFLASAVYAPESAEAMKSAFARALRGRMRG